MTEVAGRDITVDKCERRKVSGFKYGNFPSNNTVEHNRFAVGRVIQEAEAYGHARSNNTKIISGLQTGFGQDASTA